MQKMKNIINEKDELIKYIKNSQSGITLIVLVITIVVMIIIIGTTLYLGTDSVNETKDKVLKSELHVVQQAVISEYIKADKMGYTNSDDKPSNFVGDEVTNLPDLPGDSEWEITEKPVEKYKSYYKLTPENLKKIGITNCKNTYIINYYTGEVYNLTKQRAKDGEELYIKATNNLHVQKDKDTESFNDW